MTERQSEYRISQEESRRIQILKLWLTVMVILWHADRTDVHFSSGDVLLQAPIWLEVIRTVLSRIIVRCSVPGFFFLAGVLLFRKPFTWKDNMKKKVRTLLIPYVLLNSFWILFYFIGQSIPALQSYFANSSKLIASWGIPEFLNAYLGLIPNSDGTSFNPMVAPLWFVRDLFVLNLVAPVLRWVLNKFPKLSLAVLAVLLVLNVQSPLFFLSSTALIYFCLGGLLVQSGRHLTDLDRIPVIPLACLYAVCVFGAWLLLELPIGRLIRTVSILVGLCFFFRCATRFPSPATEQRLLWAAEYTFPIYLFHEPALGMLQKLSARFLGTGDAAQALTYFAAPVLIFFCTLLFSVLLQRFLPPVYSLVTGSRKSPVERR